MSKRMLVGAVSLENRHFTKMFLYSLYRNQQEELCDSLIIDNGSQKDDILSLQREFPHTRFIRNVQHAGVSPAWNQILKQEGYDYYCISNNDVLLGPNFVGIMKDFMDTHPMCGIASPFCQDCRQLEAQEINDRYWSVRGLFRDENQIVRAMKYTYLDHASGPDDWSGFDEFCLMCEEKYPLTQTLPQVLGSCFIIRKEVLNDIGYFDEAFCNDQTKIGLSEDFVFTAKLRNFQEEGKQKWSELLCLSSPILHASMQTRGNPVITKQYHQTDPASWEAQRHQNTAKAHGSDLKP